MTGEQSRLLKIGDRVCRGATTTDLGKIIGTSLERRDHLLGQWRSRFSLAQRYDED
jgi:hypothetical protein